MVPKTHKYKEKPLRTRRRERSVPGGGIAIHDTRSARATVTQRYRVDGTPIPEPSVSTLNGNNSSRYAESIPHLTERSLITDDSHVTPKPVKAPRKQYSPSEKRWLRANGLWPLPKSRVPWKRRTVICDGPCTHHRVWTKSPDVRIKLTPQPLHSVYATGLGGPHEVGITLDIVPTGKLSIDPGYSLTQAAIPPEGYSPWLASESWERGLNLARRNALENFLPKLGYGLQGALAALEIADLSSVVGAVAKVGKFISKPNPLITKGKKVCSVNRLWDAIWRAAKRRALGKEVSDWGLLHQFAVLPLVGDLSKFLLTVADFQKQIKEIYNHAGTNQVSHCQEAIRLDSYDVGGGFVNLSFDTSEDLLGIPMWSPVPQVPCEGNIRCPYIDRVVPSKLKYHLTVRYSYFVPDLYGLESVLLALDAFGLKPTVSQLWAHVPFSFLVDWVVPVGKYLEDHVDKFFDTIQVRIASSVESISVNWTREAGKPTIALTADWLDLPHETDVTIGDPYLWTGKSYSRSIHSGLPSVTGPPLKLPRGMQMATAGLLVLQRVKTV